MNFQIKLLQIIINFFKKGNVKMRFSFKRVSQLFFISFNLCFFTNANAISTDLPIQMKEIESLNLKMIDKTPTEDVQKIRKTKQYPLNYSEAFSLLELNLLNDQSPFSLFHYTYLSEESKSDRELTQEKILKTMMIFYYNTIC